MSGRIHRDLILLGANATIRRGARIDGDVLSVGGSLTFEEIPGGLSSDAASSAAPPQVGGRIRTITALEAAVVSELETSPLTSGKTSPLVLSFRLFLLFCWLVVSIGLLFLAPRPVLRAADDAPRPPRVSRRARRDRGPDRGLPRGVRAVRPAGPARARPRRRAARGARRREDLRSRGALRRRWAAALTRGAARGDLLFGDPAALALGLLLLGARVSRPGRGPSRLGRSRRSRESASRSRPPPHASRASRSPPPDRLGRRALAKGREGERDPMTPGTIGVVGAGQMGAGIAHVAALAGKRVVLVDVTPDLAGKGLEGIEKNLSRQVEKGKVSALGPGRGARAHRRDGRSRRGSPKPVSSSRRSSRTRPSRGTSSPGSTRSFRPSRSSRRTRRPSRSRASRRARSGRSASSECTS